MKKFIVLAIASLSIFRASNAMDAPPSLMQAAAQGDETAIDALVANSQSKISYEDGLEALETAIKGGYVVLIPKLLSFLSGFEIRTNDTSDADDAMGQEVSDVAIPCACAHENEQTAISMLEVIFGYPGLPKTTSDGSHDAFKAAVTLQHQNVIKALRESDKVTFSIMNLIAMSYSHNYQALSIHLLKNMNNKKLAEKKSCQTMCAAAHDNKLEYLNAFLAEPEITDHLSKESLEAIKTAVEASQLMSGGDKEAVKKKLAEIAYSKGWCVIL